MQGIDTDLQKINIIQNIFNVKGYAIGVINGTDINITNNKIYLSDRGEAGVGIFILAYNSVVEKNLIEAEPDEKNDTSRALGGINILGGSDGIKILQNKITGGSGNGITLSSFNPLNIVTTSANKDTLDNVDKNSSVSLSTSQTTTTTTTTILAKPYSYFIFNIKIQDNEIINMGLSGIGTRLAYNINADPKIGHNNPIINLSIANNRISSCMQLPFTGDMLSMTTQYLGIGFGGIILEDCRKCLYS